MAEDIQSNFKLKIFISIFLTPILSLGFLIGQAKAGWAEHLVISAAQITEGEGKTNHDFVEIYNPTANDINLKGYRLVKRTKAGISDTSIKSWTDDVVIKAHSWRLWASSDDEAYSLAVGADDSTKQTIAPDNGIAIRFGALDSGEIIDSVAWGEAENIFREGAAAPVLRASESLVRNPGISGGGNGEDANNNAGDFSVIANYIGHNSQAVPAPAIETVSGIDPAQVPVSSPALDFNPIASASPSQKIFPVAEAGPDKEAVVGENIDFDGSDSFDPQGKEIIFTWDFGDKSSAKGMNASHSYSAFGEYTVILKADNGENISEDQLKVKIAMPEFSDKIILSEIFPNPIGADKDGEWIELFNAGEAKINLRGWILATSAKSSGKQYVFSGDKVIEAKKFLVVRRSESSLVLTNESGKVSLAMSADKILSEASYGTAKEGKSYAFVGTAWQWVDVPTPGKENSGKIIAAVSQGKENSNLSGDALKNNKTEEFLDSGEEAGSNAVIKPALTKSSSPSLLKNIDIENYLNKLISEKVDSAILKAKASEAGFQDKTPVLAGNTNENKCEEPDKASVCKEFCLENEKSSENSRKDVRKNPWFYGDLALSALSLFLVWRYQEVRKKLKN